MLLTGRDSDDFRQEFQYGGAANHHRRARFRRKVETVPCLKRCSVGRSKPRRCKADSDKYEDHESGCGGDESETEVSLSQRVI